MPYYLFAATTAIVGHNWPLCNRFKGGRGQSSLIGGFLVVDWLGTLVTSFGGMLLGMLGFLVGPRLMIPWLWFRTRDPWPLAYAVVINLIIVFAMIPEIRARRERACQGIVVDHSVSWEAIPMFSMMRRMGERLGLFQDLQ